MPNSWSYVSIHNDGQILGSVDSQFGHLFTVGADRDEACRRMTRLIHHTTIIGNIKHGLRFSKKILEHPVFRKLNTHTTLWIESDIFDDSASSMTVPASTSFHNGLSDLVEPISIDPDKFEWIIALLLQGWYRLQQSNDYTAELNKNGHQQKTKKCTDVSIQVSKNNIETSMNGTVHIGKDESWNDFDTNKISNKLIQENLKNSQEIINKMHKYKILKDNNIDIIYLLNKK